MGALDIDYPRALLVAFTVVVLGTLVATGATSTAAFGSFNPSWDGASALRDHATDAGVEPVIVRTGTRYESVSADSSLAVILSPDRPYSPTDLDRINQFVRKGGTLLVAEDYGGNTNPLLTRLGASARINGTSLRDDHANYRSPAFPVANNVSSHPLVANVSSLTLNHATVVKPNGAHVLVHSSSFAYLDENGNRELDEAETIGRYPVATVERVGQGRVIVVSDPSIFINAMLDRPGNAAFITSLLTHHDRLLLDTSHTADVPPLVNLLLSVRASPLLQLVISAIGLALIAVVAQQPAITGRLRDRFTRPTSGETRRLTSDELARIIETRHPEWDEARIRRVMQHLGQTDTNEPSHRNQE